MESPQGRCCCHSPITDQNTKASRAEVTCPLRYGRKLGEPGRTARAGDVPTSWETFHRLLGQKEVFSEEQSTQEIKQCGWGQEQRFLKFTGLWSSTWSH